MDIQSTLKNLQDKKYKDFCSKLIPNINNDKIIGVRAPALKNLAKQLVKKSQIDFLQTLPHEYLEENTLHAYMLSQIENFDKCIAYIDKFLPHIDNWATCDCLRPKCLKNNPSQLFEHIKVWIKSHHAYTIRFAIEMLMLYFLNDNFKPEYCGMVAQIKSDEYYVNMMIAWYFATALAKQYDTALTYIEKQKLPLWIHNKTIQKAIESYLISSDKKQYLKTLKRK